MDPEELANQALNSDYNDPSLTLTAGDDGSGDYTTAQDSGADLVNQGLTWLGAGLSVVDQARNILQPVNLSQQAPPQAPIIVQQPSFLQRMAAALKVSTTTVVAVGLGLVVVIIGLLWVAFHHPEPKKAEA